MWSGLNPRADGERPDLFPPCNQATSKSIRLNGGYPSYTNHTGWQRDLNGHDYRYWLDQQFARGEAAFLLVADGTRPETLEFALALQRELRLPQPFWLLLNRCDLASQWSVPAALLDQVREQGGQVRLTSGRTGEGVDDAFRAFAGSLVRQP